jgi:DNA-binding response OmpR family regulator
MTLLYVDDDTDDLELLADCVSSIDSTIQCMLFQRSPEAMAYLRSAETLPDFIFLDINMPLMNGKQCLQEIRKNDTLKHLPVIMYTTSNEEREIKECYKLGASDFLIKPSNINELIHGLTSIFENHRNERMKTQGSVINIQ